MQEFEEHWDDNCPNCSVGRIIMSNKPYLRLFHGQLFTIPDAVCYHCDMCNYHEFDDSIFDVISEMIFAATQQRNHEDKGHRLPSTLDDDAPQQHKPPHL